MLFRSLCEAPRLGLPTMLHAEPFQSSVSVRSLLNMFWKKVPTVHTACVDSATALRRSAKPLSATAGVGTTLQAAPFQCNESVSTFSTRPTAQTSLKLIAATPCKKLPSTPWFALGTILQALPFQCKVSVRASAPTASEMKLPTAQTSFAAMAMTAERPLFVSRPPLGLGTTYHFVPFQCKVSVLSSLLKNEPTAQMSFAETTAIPDRKLNCGAPLKPLGLGTTVHFVPFQCSTNVL